MEILSGVHGWTLLPSEAELTIRFATSRNALRDALDLLRREGIVERVPGAGTCEPRPSIDTTGYRDWPTRWRMDIDG
jgi:DNA-binding FadR family transcriptional regulator